MVREFWDFALNLPNERGFSLSPAHRAGISRQMQRPSEESRLRACRGGRGAWSLRLRNVAVSWEIWFVELLRRLHLRSVSKYSADHSTVTN